MTRWRLKCMECGTEWVLPVSFRLDTIGRIYHYCRTCKKSTFHTVLGMVEEDGSGNPVIGTAEPGHGPG